jgi:hypothetical protein
MMEVSNNEDYIYQAKASLKQCTMDHSYYEVLTSRRKFMGVLLMIIATVHHLKTIKLDMWGVASDFWLLRIMSETQVTQVKRGSSGSSW